MWFKLMLVAACAVSQVLGYTDKTVLACLSDQGLSDFVMLLQNAQVDSTLTGTGPFTVLAPSNRAIARADPNVMDALAKEPVLLKQVMQYHIIEDYKVLPQIAAAQSLQSMEGQPITFSGSVGNLLINNSTRLSGDGSDIVCNNGIIHIIDSVLIPPVFSTNNIATVLITRDDVFKDMFMALLLNNLTNILEGSEFTLFAPTDLAFGRFVDLNNLNNRPGNTTATRHIYNEVFKYHMVPGRRTSHQLRDGEKLYTLHGYPVDVTINANGIQIDAANVVEADIAASNGVIHAVDHVLFPQDLIAQLTASG